MRLCIGCGQPTEGSVGRAGIKWRMICQPCKDEQDNRLEGSLQDQNTRLDKLLAGFSGTANLNNKE